MNYFTEASTSRMDSLRALRQEIQNTLSIPGLKPRDWGAHQRSLPNAAIPSLNLPPPEGVDHIFNDLPLSSQLQAEIKNKYVHTLEKMQQVHRQKYEQACQDLSQLSQINHTQPLSSLMEGLRKIYESMYTNRYLPMIRSEIVALRSMHPPISEVKKIPFNAECTPLLERYFEFNAYPSAPDRQILAQKTAMTTRQIEVWFQNHRKRAKENGKVVSRILPNTSHGLFPSVAKLASPGVPTLSRSQTKPETAMVSDEDGPPTSWQSKSTTTERTDPFSTSSTATALHVFPRRFSLSTAIYHFDTDTNFTFLPPVWARKPSSQPILRPDIDFNDFVVMFGAKLNIRDGSSKSKRRSLFRSQTQKPWFLATTTIPSCAPHPAFIRSPQPSYLPSQSIRALSNTTTLPSVSPEASASPSLPPSVTQPRSFKKAAPFPKRYPSKYYPCSGLASPTHRRSSRVHSVDSMVFGSRASSIKHLPSRTSGVNVTDSSWVGSLEFTPPPASKATAPQYTLPAADQAAGVVPPSASLATTLDYATPFASRLASVDCMTSSASSVMSIESASSSRNRVTSFDSVSSLGSRNSSISSIESPLPASPTLQPQTDDNIILDHQDLQFLGDLFDFDQLMTGQTQIPFNDNMSSPKPDGMFGYAFPYLQNTIASFPMNFMQTFS